VRRAKHGGGGGLAAGTLFASIQPRFRDVTFTDLLRQEYPALRLPVELPDRDRLHGDPAGGIPTWLHMAHPPEAGDQGSGVMATIVRAGVRFRPVSSSGP